MVIESAGHPDFWGGLLVWASAIVALLGHIMIQRKVTRGEAIEIIESRGREKKSRQESLEIKDARSARLGEKPRPKSLPRTLAGVARAVKAVIVTSREKFREKDLSDFTDSQLAELAGKIEVSRFVITPSAPQAASHGAALGLRLRQALTEGLVNTANRAFLEGDPDMLRATYALLVPGAVLGGQGGARLPRAALHMANHLTMGRPLRLPWRIISKDPAGSRAIEDSVQSVLAEALLAVKSGRELPFDLELSTSRLVSPEKRDLWYATGNFHLEGKHYLSVSRKPSGETTLTVRASYRVNDPYNWDRPGYTAEADAKKEGHRLRLSDELGQYLVEHGRAHEFLVHAAHEETRTFALANGDEGLSWK